MSLRRRIEKSKWLSGAIGGLLSRYLALCNRTTDWQIEGLDDMKDALSEGPILLMMWHSRMAMGAPHWPSDHAPVTSLHHRSPLGRISGVMQRYEGLTPFEMSATRSNLVASRAVMKRFHQGISIVMTGDGPVGPAHKLQDAPWDWASRMGAPVFAYAFSTTRGHRFNSWDRLLLPYPNGRGAQVFARFDAPIPRKLTGPNRMALRNALEGFMNTTTARADAILGLSPGP